MNISKYISIEKWLDSQVWDDRSPWVDIVEIHKLPKWMRILGFNIKYEVRIVPRVFPLTRYMTNEEENLTYGESPLTIAIPGSVLEQPTEVTEVQLCWFNIIIRRYII